MGHDLSLPLFFFFFYCCRATHLMDKLPSTAILCWGGERMNKYSEIPEMINALLKRSLNQICSCSYWLLLFHYLKKRLVLAGGAVFPHHCLWLWCDLFYLVESIETPLCSLWGWVSTKIHPMLLANRASADPAVYWPAGGAGKFFCLQTHPSNNCDQQLCLMPPSLSADFIGSLW